MGAWAPVWAAALAAGDADATWRGICLGAEEFLRGRVDPAPRPGASRLGGVRVEARDAFARRAARDGGAAPVRIAALLRRVRQLELLAL